MDRKSKRKIAKPRVALVGDGQTEQIYFFDLRETDRPSDLDIFPDLPSACIRRLLPSALLY
jgi:hypothetical protein